MRKVIYLIGLFFIMGFAYYLGASKNNNPAEEITHLAPKNPPSDQNDLKSSQIKGVEPIINKVNSSHPSKKISPDASRLITELQDEKVAAKSEAKAVSNNLLAAGHDGPMMVDPKTPLRHKHTFDQEARLESWAAPSEKLLTESVQHSQLGDRYKLESIECKTTLCITKVSIPVDKTNSEMERDFGWYEIVNSMRQSELDQNLSEYETAVYIDESSTPRIIYESTFIKKNNEQN